MLGFRGAAATAACLSLLVFSWPALAAGLQPDRLPVRIAVNEALGPVERVAKWDPASPQELVRIDGDLFQESDGFYYRVVEDRISVRLADGVADWNDLVGRAFASDPGAYADLPDLVVERSNRLGIVDLILPGGDPTEWCERIFRTGLVRYAEVATFGVFLATANDPYYPQQWALRNTGQSGGVPGADIDAELAWDLTTGNPDIVVGVLDSGTYITHPDLDLNVWHNDDEIPNNGVDDDGNGFIDDVDGWDFPNNNNNVASNNFHGTHVTGIIVAEGNNNLGVVGLVGGLGSPGVRAMAVAVGESYPVTSVMDDAMLYAVDNGAQVVTMSLSVGQTSAFDNALDYAYNTKDVFIDCAAGNNGSSVTYPATRGEVMAVAASTRYDTHASFSNPGPQLEVTAPGQDIYSTQLGGSYGSSSGTSFAAPYVGALAAMIRGVNSGMSAPDVRQLIIDTAEDIESPGFDNLTGWGRINAYAAVSQAGFSDGTIELDAELYSCSQVVRLTVMDFDLGGSGSVAVTVKSGPEPDGETVFLTETAEFGVFSGALPLATGTPGTDGLLQVVHDDTIVAEYVDADDGQGGINVVKTDAATTDCAGPAIAGVTVLGVDDSMAGIRWTTDEPGTTVVRYGITVPPDQQSASDVLTLVHLAQLTDLEECTTYKFSVESADGFGNVTEDDNGGEYYSFQTWGYFPGVGVVPCRLGQAELDRTVYGCGGTAEATVVDIDLDADSAATDTVDIWMTSTSEPAGEWITLTETATDSGTFTGSIGLDDVTAGPDGVLAVATGDLITATYFDEDDGVQGPQTATATATVDCNPPAIRDVRVTALSATRAEIEWTTDKPATSRVEFGPDATLGSVVEDPELKTAHRLAISAFEACDRAFFRVSGVGEHGAVSVADVAGEPFEFNLDEIGGLVFHDNFEDDRGWSFTGEWERGTPQGQGSGSGDPVLAYSGSGVLGNDLTGTGAYPGDYEPGALEWAFSPSLDTVGIADPELILRRKLGVAPGDSATIAVEVLLQQQVWSSKAGGLDDAEWVEVRYPIPAAGDKPAVRVGFSLQSDGDGHSYGWNIDEMIVKDSNEPDYRACGGCSGPPSFGGLAAVYDPDPCGPSGLALEWQPAPAWGTGTGGTYDVHRGTTPDFVPDASNRIASDLVATTWIDATAPVDTQVWYVVRARNDEDCTGGEGLADGNLVRGTATETLDQALPPGLGATVQVTSIGAAHVRLVWDPVAGADHYVVRRSESADFGAAQVIGTASETLFEDVNALIDESSYFYRVFAANACGEEAP